MVLPCVARGLVRVGGYAVLQPMRPARTRHAGSDCRVWKSCQGWCGRQEAQALPNGNPTLQQEGADLIDDAGALTDQPLTHTVQPRYRARARSSFTFGARMSTAISVL